MMSEADQRRMVESHRSLMIARKMAEVESFATEEETHDFLTLVSREDRTGCSMADGAPPIPDISTVTRDAILNPFKEGAAPPPKLTGIVEVVDIEELGEIEYTE